MKIIQTFFYMSHEFYEKQIEFLFTNNNNF